MNTITPPKQSQPVYLADLTASSAIPEKFPEPINRTSNVSLTDLTPSWAIPIKFPDLYNERQWAWAVKQRHQNGLAKAFHKVGKNLFVNIKVLAECIDAQPPD